MSRDSSTAIFCSSLNFFVSLSQRTEPAPPLRIASSGFGPGKSAARDLRELADLLLERHLREERVDPLR